MTSESEVVPTGASPVEPTRPRWREQIEQATRLVVALGVEVLTANAPAEGALDTLGDVTIGAIIETERVALDGAELVIDAAAIVVRMGATFPPTRYLARRAMQQIDPVRRVGMIERTSAIESARANLPRYVDAVVNVTLDFVSLNDILERVDVERIIERVDVQAIIDRVDVQGIIERVDVQGIVERVDLNDLMARIDLDAIVGRTDLGAVIAQSTGGMASDAVDLVRRQGVGLDGFVARWAVRLRGQRLRDAPLGPPLLLEQMQAHLGLGTSDRS
jgi:hypothetical protein